MTGPQDPQYPHEPTWGEPTTPQPGQVPPGSGYQSSSGYFSQSGPPPMQPPPAYPTQPPGYAPQPGYAPPGYQQPGQAVVQVRGPVLSRHGRRQDAKFGVSLAGIGVGLVTIGVIVWGGDYLGTSIGGDSFGVSDSHRLLGIALSLVAIIAGYALTITQRTGPLTTAGVVASAFGVPVLLGFLTFTTDSGGPFQTDVLFLVSIGAWLVSYLWVRGARGHSFYLGLAAVALWIYVIDKTESSVLSFGGFVERALPIGTASSGPDWNTIGGVSVAFGIGYYLAMAALDRSGRIGAGTPFAVAGFLATAGGIAAFSVHAHTKGTAAMLIAFGLVIAWLGAMSGRRFTTWTWSFAMGAGVVTLVGDSLQNNNAGAGILLIVIGLAAVVLAWLYTVFLHEPLDDEAG